MLNSTRFRVFTHAQRLFLSTSSRVENQRHGILEDDNVETSLWFTTLPHKLKSNLLTKAKKKPKVVPEFIPKGPPIISCKNAKLNHYSGQTYDKLEAVPLASKGWYNTKSKGDYFTIHPTTDHPAFIMTRHDLTTAAGTFEEAGIETWLQDILRKTKIFKPTTVQGKSIPTILAGKNALVVAETGCGKTLCYLLPMIQRIAKWRTRLSDRPMNSPLGFIVVPNRELALQVGKVVSQLCEGTDIFCQTIIGGHSKQLLLHPQPENIDIVVSTLGVISKLTTHRLYSTRYCKHLVLDEADTLLDDSFNEKLLSFVNRFQITYSGSDDENDVPSGTQVTLASATMPTSLDNILGRVVAMDSLEKISTKYLHRVLPHVPQTFLRVGKPEKAEQLLRLVRKSLADNSPMMIFSNKTECCDWVSLFLNENGYPCERINSRMPVDQRLGRYQRFVSGEVDIISCTDLTSRGIDSTRVKHVVNFDFPLYMADYIHRCGRTGRIGHDKNCQITNIIASRREINLLLQIETAARTFKELHNVNNNINRIIYYKKEKAMEVSNQSKDQQEKKNESNSDDLPLERNEGDRPESQQHSQ